MAPLPADRVPYCYDPKNGKPSWFTGFQQMLLVDGDKEVGKYLIASDTYPLYENYESMSPSGIHVDLKEWFWNYEKTKEICEYILPGHDMKVLEQKIYGKKL